MATVQMSRFAAEGGRMPPVCICCGSAARQHVRHTFYYQPSWLVLFYILLPRPLKWYLSSNPAAVVVPVCGSHGRRLKWPTYISYALAGGLLLLVPALLAASIAGWLNLLSGLLLLALAWAVGFWVLHVVITLMTPRAEHYTASHITLTAVAPAFAHSLQAGGAGVQQGARPLPGLGGPKTVGGMTQGMLALVILGIGGLCFLAVCFMIGFGSYYARKSRLRQFEQMAQNPPQYQPPQFGPPTFTPPSPPPASAWTPPLAPPNNQAPPQDVVLNPNTDPNNVTPVPSVPTPPPPPTPVETTTSLPTAGELPSAASPTRYSPGSPETPWNEKGEFVFANPGNNFEPTAFPNNSSPVNISTPLSVGDRVWVLEGGAWVSGIVKEVLGATQVKVHTPPAPESFAQVHSRSAVRLARATSASASTSESESSPAAGTNPSGQRIVDDPSFGESTEKIFSQIPPPGSKPVTAATPLQPRNKVWHLWGSQWYPCEVVSLLGADMVKVHYFNFASNFDEDVPRSALRLPGGSRIVSRGGSPTASTTAKTSTDAATPSAAPSAHPDVRTWTDATGKFKIEAKLLEFKDGKVKLERTDGKIVTLPFDKLSAADQFFVETKNP